MATSYPPSLPTCPFRAPGRERCPSAQELSDYASHRLAPLSAMQLVDQLERCPTCRAVVEQHLEESDDSPPNLDTLLGQATLAALVQSPGGLSEQQARWLSEQFAPGLGGQCQVAPDRLSALCVIPVGTGRFAGAHPPAEGQDLRFALQLMARALAAELRDCRVHASVSLGPSSLESASVEEVLEGARADLQRRGAGLWLQDQALRVLPEPRSLLAAAPAVEQWLPLAIDTQLTQEEAPARHIPPRPHTSAPAPVHRGVDSTIGWREPPTLPQRPGLVPGLILLGLILAMLLGALLLRSNAPDPQARARAVRSPDGGVELLVDLPQDHAVQVLCWMNTTLNPRCATGPTRSDPNGTLVYRIPGPMDEDTQVMVVLDGPSAADWEAQASRSADAIQDELNDCTDGDCETVVRFQIPAILKEQFEERGETAPLMLAVPRP